MVIAMRSKNISTWCKAKWKQFSDRSTTLLDWLIAILVIVLVLVMLMPESWLVKLIEHLLGTSNKKETLTFIGIGIIGLMLWHMTLSAKKQEEAMVKQGEAMVKRAEAMAAAMEHRAKANEITEAGHVQERLKTSIEHLGDDKASVRIGATFELYHLATGCEDYRETVCCILCGHIRQKTQKANYQKQYIDKPSEEIQTCLNLLCGKEKGHVFNSCKRNLTSSFLQGANLKGAQLQGTDLTDAQLQGANLLGAQLQGVSSSSAPIDGKLPRMDM